MPGPASSDGRECASEIFASMGKGSNPAALGFFCVELKYIPLICDFESSKYVAEFGHVSTSKNQDVFTVWTKGEI